MKQFLKNNYSFILIFLFIIMSSLTMFMIGDDYIWFYTFTDDRLEANRSENGRYLTNIITRFEMQSDLFFNIFYIVTFSAMIILMGFLVKKKVRKPVKFLSVFILINLIPPSAYGQVFRWKSGFPNYCLSAVLTFLFMFFVFRILFEDYKPNKFLSFSGVLVGFFGSLCVEHITLYNVLLSIVFILMFIKLKKPLIHILPFFIGAICGAVLMFTHPQYHVIANDGDNLGLRSFEFSLVDSFMKVYSFILPYFCKHFLIVHVIVTLSFAYLYYKSPAAKKNKYSLPCIIICLLFTLYSVFSLCLQDFVDLSGAMKISSIQFAFTFIYFCALIYNVITYLGSESRIRALIYIISPFVLAAPFLVVSPITARCFFNGFLFWIMFALEVTFSAFGNCEFIGSKFFERCLSTISCGFFIIFANIFITNWYFNSVRFDYMREQFDQNKSVIDVVILPYSNYTCDDFIGSEALFKPSFEKKLSYGLFIMKYYGIEYDPENPPKFNEISAYDYNLIKDA